MIANTFMPIHLSDIVLDHDSYIALHEQLHNSLRQLIISGRWQTGERVPSEPRLAKHLNISRSTIRIALQKAEIEGLITRQAGRGTFVTYDATLPNQNRVVAYVARSFHNEIHQVLLSTAETELRSEGYNVLFSNARTNADEVRILEQLLQDNISGLLIWANASVTPEQRAMLHTYQARNIPIVFIDRMVDGVKGDYVGCDNFGGTYALMQHLFELGHTRIAYLTHNIDSLYPIEERYRGFQQAMQEQRYVDYQQWKITSPQSQVFMETDLTTLLDDHDDTFSNQVIDFIEKTSPRPTAIVCVNDALALLTMRAIRKMGLRVPEDISVVGFDDIQLAAYVDTPLTTVSQNAYAIGQLAAQSLLERLDGLSVPTRHHTVPTRLQIRMSATTPIEFNPAHKE
ncbi:MAG: GntR family transcriptional regulator [Chloroflexota bacterium]